MSTRYPFAVIKEQLHARKGTVADFAIGGRRVPLAEGLREWIHSNPDLALKSATPDEFARFRSAAAEYLAREYNADVGERRIVPVPGGRVGMSAFIACVIRQGDVVAVTDPGYPAFARMAAHRHAEVKHVLLDPQREFAPALESLTEDDLAKLRVIALNYPNNPTGAVISQQTRSVVRATAEETGAVVFNDAVYGPLTFTGSSSCLLSGSAESNFGDDLVELHSLTKLYPLGPQSGSFLVGSEETILEIANYSEFAWAPMSALQLGATTWCLGDSEGRSVIREFYREQLNVLRDALTGLGFAVYPTPSGIYALCKVPGRIGKSAVHSATEAAAILLDDYDIAVVPFDVPGNSYLRFCSMFMPEDLQRLANSGLQIGDHQVDSRIGGQ